MTEGAIVLEVGREVVAAATKDRWLREWLRQPPLTFVSTSDVVERMNAIANLVDAEAWGVWCLTDRAWCDSTIGTEAHARAQLPKWASGEAAAVDSSHFRYEVRELAPNDTARRELAKPAKRDAT